MSKIMGRGVRRNWLNLELLLTTIAHGRLAICSHPPPLGARAGVRASELALALLIYLF